MIFGVYPLLPQNKSSIPCFADTTKLLKNALEYIEIAKKAQMISPFIKILNIQKLDEYGCKALVRYCVKILGVLTQYFLFQQSLSFEDKTLLEIPVEIDQDLKNLHNVDTKILEKITNHASLFQFVSSLKGLCCITAYHHFLKGIF